MFSVLMTIYKNDNVDHLKEAINSILNQTLKPDEFLIVKDGPLRNETEDMLDSFKDPCLRYISLKTNIGQSMALNIGINNCKHEIVARMDSDDISTPDRLEKQYNILKQNPSIDIIGTGILEFTNSPNDASKSRVLPNNHEDIVKYSKFRCPVNHATVMYKKSKVIEAGNYSDIFSVADYLLWIKMIKNGCNFHNIPEPLLLVRGGSEMYKRRSGLKYASAELQLQGLFYSLKHINLYEYIRNITLRFMSSMSPNFLRGYIYSNFLRSSKDVKK